MRLVRLLKHPGEGIGLRVGSNEGGVFVRELYKNGPADVDGRLEIGTQPMSHNNCSLLQHHKNCITDYMNHLKHHFLHTTYIYSMLNSL